MKGQRWAHRDINAELRAAGRPIEYVGGEVLTGRSRVTFRCLADPGHGEWVAKVYKIFTDSHYRTGCPACGRIAHRIAITGQTQPPRWTEERVAARLDELRAGRPDQFWADVRMVSMGVNGRDVSTSWGCATCGHEWTNAIDRTLRSGVGCPRCSARARGLAAQVDKSGRAVRRIRAEQLIAIDGDRCGYCQIATSTEGGPYSATYPNVDHIRPVSKGGADEPDNVVLACHSCNALKSDLDLFDQFWPTNPNARIRAIMLARTHAVE